MYVSIGEKINISCWFDPSLVQNSKTKIQQHKQPKQQTPQLKEIDDFSYSAYNPYNYDADFNYGLKKKRRRRYQHHKRSDYSSSPDHDRGDEQKFLRTPKDKPVFSSKNYLEPKLKKQQEHLTPKYELDWYFIDKNGQMNIISYGSETKSNMKYQTFLHTLNNNEYSEDDPTTGTSDDFLPYSSSALYSQTSSSKSQATVNTNNDQINNIYYLTTLIESEEDEGVYQCINPDFPDLILQNVTVMFKSKLIANWNLKAISQYFR